EKPMSFDTLEMSLAVMEQLAPIETKVRLRRRSLADEIGRAAESIALNVSEGRQRAGLDRPDLYRKAAGSAVVSSLALPAAISKWRRLSPSRRWRPSPRLSAIDSLAREICLASSPLWRRIRVSTGASASRTLRDISSASNMTFLLRRPAAPCGRALSLTLSAADAHGPCRAHSQKPALSHPSVSAAADSFDHQRFVRARARAAALRGVRESPPHWSGSSKEKLDALGG